jgi:ribonucleotide reductase beta subunit family protein with ferritin-like domain
MNLKNAFFTSPKMNASFSPKNTDPKTKMDETIKHVSINDPTPASETAPAQVVETPEKTKKAKTPRASPSLTGRKSRKTSVGETEMPSLTLETPAIATETAEEPVQKRVLVPEPMQLASEDRFVIFPIKHSDLWAKYKQHMSVFWTPEEIDLSKDMKDWERLTDNERHFIKNILGFFAGSDGIVMENLALRFTRDVQWPEAKFFYACQNLLEAVHSETYSLLIDTYITDKAEKEDLLRAIQTIPCVKKKAEWALAWIDNKDADIGTRLIGFAAVEGIFFSGAFCAIFWMKQRGLMPGLTLSNEFIARDEGIHTEFACLLYGKVVNRLDKKTVHKIIREAVKIEKQFITKSLPCELIGMNAKMMSQYIEFVADRLLLQLGYSKAYNSSNPFPFMERISLENKDNFFEKRVSTYAKGSVGKKREEMTFATNAEF